MFGVIYILAGSLEEAADKAQSLGLAPCRWKFIESESEAKGRNPRIITTGTFNLGDGEQVRTRILEAGGRDITPS